MIAQIFTAQHPERVRSLVLLSSLAKTALPPNIEWKVRNLLPVLELLGAYVRVVYVWVYVLLCIFVLVFDLLTFHLFIYLLIVLFLLLIN